MSRDTWAAIVATIAVTAVVAVGWHFLGGPSAQRQIQSDLRIVRALGELAQRIDFEWESSKKVLPADLEKLHDSVKQNPITHIGITYHRKSDSTYELCANFTTDSRNLPNQNGSDFWAHPKGDYCFQLDASQQPPPIPYFY
jgi:hypothetical protein